MRGITVSWYMYLLLIFIKIICRRLRNFEEAIATSKREKVSPLIIVIIIISPLTLCRFTTQ